MRVPSHTASTGWKNKEQGTVSLGSLGPGAEASTCRPDHDRGQTIRPRFHDCLSRNNPARWCNAALVLALLTAGPCLAAHPLITEDTHTQGQGNAQLEFTAEYGHDEAADAREDAVDLAAVLTWGLRDNLDLLLTLPYSRADTMAGGMTMTVHGIGDAGLDAKWRFYQQGPLSVALKGGASFATGDETRGLGAGKPNVNLNLVASYETAGWGLHLHLGLLRNRNVHDERDVIHHASVALTRMATDRLQLVADLGRFTATDRLVDEDIRFLTLGAIYGVRDDFDIDMGVKRGLSDPETDTTLQLGLAYRF